METLNFNNIKYLLIKTANQFNELIQLYNSDPNCQGAVGFDIETTGMDYIHLGLVGISIYLPKVETAIYIPLAQEDESINIDLSSIEEELQGLFNSNVIIMHNATFDLKPMMRQGFKFDRILCTNILATMLQNKCLGLKDLILDYGVASPEHIMTLKTLMAKTTGKESETLIEEDYDFSKVKMEENSFGLKYVCNDAIFTYYLQFFLLQEYRDLVGIKTSETIITAEMQAAVIMAGASAEGFMLNRKILDEFIEDFDLEHVEHVVTLEKEVRQMMDWT